MNAMTRDGGSVYVAKADLNLKATVCGSGKTELRMILAIGSNNDRNFAK